MSQENVELVQRAYDLLNAGDIEGLLSMLSPDIELDERYLAPDAAIYRGHDGVRRWLRRGSDAIEEPHFEVLRWFHGGDAVVTDVTVRVRGAGSGLETGARLARAIRVSDGKATYVASFPSVEQALEAAGLGD
jgi:ketosteroid isomerase-like protein